MNDTTAIARAARILQTGGLVAFPTETVYGVGADARNPDAVRKIFAAKRRPADHPVIVHLRSADEVVHWARETPPAAQKLMRHFWPGPLTLIFRRASDVINEVTGGQDTVGLRAPSHPLAHALLDAFGGGIAAPSANRFGRISPTTAAHVHEELGHAVDMVLDGGACEFGIESTIVDVTSGSPRLLRPGGIAAHALESVLNREVGSANALSPRASGTLAAHYAPSARMLLIQANELQQAVQQYAQNSDAAFLVRRSPPRLAGKARWHVAPSDAKAYAHALYATLRALDREGFRLLLVEAPPDGPEWDAVRDRLRRAATGSGREDLPSEENDDAP